LSNIRPNFTTEIIAAAIEGFEAAKARIDAQVEELRTMLLGRSAEMASTPEASKRKRQKMSAAGRRAIAEAQRKRWAQSRKQPELASKTVVQEGPKKRKLSAAGRQAIIAATKRRWAAVRAAKVQQEEAVRRVVKKKVTVKKAAVKAAPAKAAKRRASVKKAATKAKVKGTSTPAPIQTVTP